MTDEQRDRQVRRVLQRLNWGWLFWAVAGGLTGLGLLGFGVHLAVRVAGGGPLCWSWGLVAFFLAMGLAVVLHAVHVWTDRKALFRALRRAGQREGKSS